MDSSEVQQGRIDQVAKWNTTRDGSHSVVHSLVILYRFQDGARVKSLWPGCCWAYSILLALPVHRAPCTTYDISSSVGSWMTMIHQAVLMIRWRAFLSCVQLETQAAVPCVMKESRSWWAGFAAGELSLRFEGSGTSGHPFWVLQTSGWAMKWPTSVTLSEFQDYLLCLLGVQS